MDTLTNILGFAALMGIGVVVVGVVVFLYMRALEMLEKK
jgi:hypothetical protein